MHRSIFDEAVVGSKRTEARMSTVWQGCHGLSRPSHTRLFGEVWRERVGIEPTRVVNASQSVLKTASSTSIPTVPISLYIIWAGA